MRSKTRIVSVSENGEKRRRDKVGHLKKDIWNLCSFLKNVEECLRHELSLEILVTEETQPGLSLENCSHFCGCTNIVKVYQDICLCPPTGVGVIIEAVKEVC